MPFRTWLIVMAFFFMAFVLEQLPLAPLFSWFQPQWVLMVVTVLALKNPERYGLWMAVPFGLMLDVEQASPLGLNVLLLSVHIALLQWQYRRLYIANLVVMMGVVVMLVILQQILRYWVVALVGENTVPVQIWQPAIVSALVWPWLATLLDFIMRRLNIS